MKKQEIEIIITPEGDVKATVKGIKGKRCVEEAAPLVKAAGERKYENLTSEYYESETKSDIQQKRK